MDLLKENCDKTEKNKYLQTLNDIIRRVNKKPKKLGKITTIEINNRNHHYYNINEKFPDKNGKMNNNYNNSTNTYTNNINFPPNQHSPEYVKINKNKIEHSCDNNGGNKSQIRCKTFEYNFLQKDSKLNFTTNYDKRRGNNFSNLNISKYKSKERNNTSNNNFNISKNNGRQSKINNRTPINEETKKILIDQLIQNQESECIRDFQKQVNEDNLSKDYKLLEKKLKYIQEDGVDIENLLQINSNDKNRVLNDDEKNISCNKNRNNNSIDEIKEENDLSNEEEHKNNKGQKSPLSKGSKKHSNDNNPKNKNNSKNIGNNDTLINFNTAVKTNANSTNNNFYTTETKNQETFNNTNNFENQININNCNINNSTLKRKPRIDTFEFLAKILNSIDTNNIINTLEQKKLNENLNNNFIENENLGESFRKKNVSNQSNSTVSEEGFNYESKKNKRNKEEIKKFINYKKKRNIITENEKNKKDKDRDLKKFFGLYKLQENLNNINNRSTFYRSTHEKSRISDKVKNDFYYGNLKLKDNDQESLPQMLYSSESTIVDQNSYYLDLISSKNLLSNTYNHNIYNNNIDSEYNYNGDQDNDNINIDRNDGFLEKNENQIINNNINSNNNNNDINSLNNNGNFLNNFTNGNFSDMSEKNIEPNNNNYCNIINQKKGKIIEKTDNTFNNLGKALEDDIFDKCQLTLDKANHIFNGEQLEQILNIYKNNLFKKDSKEKENKGSKSQDKINNSVVTPSICALSEENKNENKKSQEKIISEEEKNKGEEKREKKIHENENINPHDINMENFNTFSSIQEKDNNNENKNEKNTENSKSHNDPSIQVPQTIQTNSVYNSIENKNEKTEINQKDKQEVNNKKKKKENNQYHFNEKQLEYYNDIISSVAEYLKLLTQRNTLNDIIIYGDMKYTYQVGFERLIIGVKSYPFNLLRLLQYKQQYDSQFHQLFLPYLRRVFETIKMYSFYYKNISNFAKLIEQIYRIIFLKNLVAYVKAKVIYLNEIENEERNKNKENNIIQNQEKEKESNNNNPSSVTKKETKQILENFLEGLKYPIKISVFNKIYEYYNFVNTNCEDKTSVPFSIGESCKSLGSHKRYNTYVHESFTEKSSITAQPNSEGNDKLHRLYQLLESEKSQEQLFQINLSELTDHSNISNKSIKNLQDKIINENQKEFKKNKKEENKKIENNNKKETDISTPLNKEYENESQSVDINKSELKNKKNQKAHPGSPENLGDIDKEGLNTPYEEYKKHTESKIIDKNKDNKNSSKESNKQYKKIEPPKGNENKKSRITRTFSSEQDISKSKDIESIEWENNYSISTREKSSFISGFIKIKKEENSYSADFNPNAKQIIIEESEIINNPNKKEVNRKEEKNKENEDIRNSGSNKKDKSGSIEIIIDNTSGQKSRNLENLEESSDIKMSNHKNSSENLLDFFGFNLAENLKNNSLFNSSIKNKVDRYALEENDENNNNIDIGENANKNQNKSSQNDENKNIFSKINKVNEDKIINEITDNIIQDLLFAEISKKKHILKKKKELSSSINSSISPLISQNSISIGSLSPGRNFNKNNNNSNNNSNSNFNNNSVQNNDILQSLVLNQSEMTMNKSIFMKTIDEIKEEKTLSTYNKIIFPKLLEMIKNNIDKNYLNIINNLKIPFQLDEEKLMNNVIFKEKSLISSSKIQFCNSDIANVKFIDKKILSDFEPIDKELRKKNNFLNENYYDNYLNLCIYDTTNELIEKQRMYGKSGLPLSWSIRSRDVDYKFNPSEYSKNIFKNIISKELNNIINSKIGLISENYDYMDMDQLNQDRDNKFAKSISKELKENDELYQTFETQETSVKMKLSRLVMEQLINETVEIFEHVQNSRKYPSKYQSKSIYSCEDIPRLGFQQPMLEYNYNSIKNISYEFGDEDNINQ